MSKTTFRQMIIEILAATGYTQAELAHLLDVSQPTISQIKTGKNENPHYRLACSIIDRHRQHCTN